MLNRINFAPVMTTRLVSRTAFGRDPFCLLDVGASLGIEPQWRIFGSQLRAYGFDPLVNECERLNQQEALSGVRYIPRWIRANGSSDQYQASRHFTSKTIWPYSRTTMVRAAELLSFRPEVLFSAGATEIKRTDLSTSLDDFVVSEGLDSVDFIKIDTDGSDFEALSSAKLTLQRQGVLGVRIEALFHGPTHPLANTWANIDSFMREEGFSLFDFDRFRLSRSALPDTFLFAAPSATFRGQVAWADALYLRDTGHPNYSTHWRELSPSKLLKLACAFEILGLADCAADVLVRHREELTSLVDVNEALDSLAEEWLPGCGGYASLQAKFDQDPTQFYPDGEVARAHLPPTYFT